MLRRSSLPTVRSGRARAGQTLDQDRSPLSNHGSLRQAAGLLQRKLAIGSPNDSFEQEANQVADQIMSGASGAPAVASSLTSGGSSRVQRRCACGGTVGPSGECEECKKKRLQRKSRSSAGAASSNASAPPIVHQVLSSPGRPLDSATRAFMEPRFGYDFGQVRVHDGARAAESARAVNALAYTVGQNVVFGAGQYSPSTRGGQQLMAHELVHTLQQSGAASSDRTRPIQVSKAEGGPEGEATRIAADVTSTSVFDYHSPAPQIRRAHLGVQRAGDLSKVPPGLPCEVATDQAPGVVGTILFGNRAATLSPLDQAQIENIVRNWRLAGANSAVRVDGYASVVGTDELNWPLSCDRARAVAAELMSPASGLPGIPSNFIRVVAQGETSEFGAEPSNRRAAVSMPIVVPPTIRTLTFRASSWSFLSCALCNPFTDDGTLGVTPPSSEPSTGSTHRQMHFLEAALATSDGRTIVPGSARLAGSGDHAGISHFCGTSGAGHITSSSRPATPTLVVSSAGIQGVQFESEMSSRVGATVPATLPGSPCGFLGTNPLIPLIGNRFRMRLFADGTKESEFISATLYPSHHIYEDGAIKLFGGSPVHPAQDFFAWASATVPLAAGLVGFHALRFACCHPFLAHATCPTTCVGGFSVPSSTADLPGCAVFGAGLAAMSCPTPCAPAGAACTPIVRGSNP